MYVQSFLYNVCSGFADIGYQPENPKQIVGIEEGPSYDLGELLHEIFHALGRYHEQSRTDRNRYIKIFHLNIMQGENLRLCRCEHNKLSVVLFTSTLMAQLGNDVM